MRGHSIAVAIAAASVAASIAVAAAAASGGHSGREAPERTRGEADGPDGRGAGAGTVDPAYAKECGACHLAYPPSLLPRESWRRLMAGLERHFGQNAELDEATRARLEGWLVDRAPPDRPGQGKPPLRVTERKWFLHEHGDVPKDAASRPAIRTLANCGACHPGAARWDFEGDRVMIPGR
jgi:hypothetical protein